LDICGSETTVRGIKKALNTKCKNLATNHKIKDELEIQIDKIVVLPGFLPATPSQVYTALPYIQYRSKPTFIEDSSFLK
jgi:hypothetical protein